MKKKLFQYLKKKIKLKSDDNFYFVIKTPCINIIYFPNLLRNFCNCVFRYVELT